MQPLSHDTPKPLMPLWGIPMLEHAINLLVSWGVRDILINVHHAPEQILQYCLNREFKSCRIQLSFESEILGTGGALKKAAWFIGNKPFWMLNTDIAAELDPAPLLKAFKKEKAIAALWMHPTLGPRTVEVKNDLVTNFASSTPGADNTYTFCGLQLLSPQILKYLPKANFCSVIDGYRNAMKKNEKVLGINCDNSFWADLGTRERYLNAHRDILEARRKNLPGKLMLSPGQLKYMTARNPASTVGFAAIGENVGIGTNVTLNDCVIWDNATLTSNSNITSSIVGNDVPIHGKVESSSAVKCNTLPTNDSVLQLSLKALRTKPENATLIALPSRGSNRSFERIQTKQRSAMLVRYESGVREENARYASHTEFLQEHGINVPRVLLDRPELNATLFQDAGTTDLESIAKGLTPKRLIATYKRVLDLLIILHNIPIKDLKTIKLEPAFNNKLYAWEHDLFTAHFLNNYLKLTRSKIKQINKELTQTADILSIAPQALLHRDMQSSNILLKNSKPTIIDFQGMRMGVAEYDIASLLCDPYIMLSEGEQNTLLKYYWGQTSSNGSKTVGPRPIFTSAAIQRLSQALGAFARLSKLADMQRYEDYILPACTMMLRMLKNREDLPELTKLMTGIVR